MSIEALTQTIRLGLLDAFVHDYPKLTEQLNRLLASVPQLFSSLFSTEEFHVVDDKDLDVKRAVVSTDTHADARVLVRIKAHVYKAMGLLVREGQMSAVFQ